ncbi:MAG: ABC transporter [Syntrophobacteraceae bacterium]
MKYQFVLQFPEEELTFDELIQIEDSLVSKLYGTANVDGHDIGSGQANIFILTDFPDEVFYILKGQLSSRHKAIVKAAYREILGNEYTILWPSGLKAFCVI